MNRKRKPALAGTKTRALSKLQKSDNTPLALLLKCPECQFEGEYKLFAVNDWLARLPELIARNPELGIPEKLSSMTMDDAYYLYCWLVNHGR